MVIIITCNNNIIIVAKMDQIPATPTYKVGLGTNKIKIKIIKSIKKNEILSYHKFDSFYW